MTSAGQATRGPRKADLEKAPCPPWVRSFVEGLPWGSRATRPGISRTVSNIGTNADYWNEWAEKACRARGLAH